MWYNYYERMVEHERRRDEHQRVYAMLAATSTPATPLQGLRVAVGHQIMRVGARLAGEAVYLHGPRPTEKHLLSQNN